MQNLYNFRKARYPTHVPNVMVGSGDIDGLRVGDLRIFQEVAGRLNYTRAAEALGSTTPTVFRRVKALEGALRVGLFAKAGRGIVLTEEGSQLLRAATEVLNELAKLEALSSDFRYRSKIVVGARVSVARYDDYLLARLLSQFRNVNPSFDIELEPSYASDPFASDVLEKVSAGLLDVGLFISAVSQNAMKRLSRRYGLKISLWREYRVAAVTGSEQSVEVLRQIREEKRITHVAMIGWSAGRASEIISWWQSQGLSVHTIETAEPQALIQRIVAEPAVAIVSSAYAGHEIESGLLKILPSPADSWRAALYVATRAQPTDATAQLVRFLLAANRHRLERRTNGADEQDSYPARLPAAVR